MKFGCLKTPESAWKLMEAPSDLSSCSPLFLFIYFWNPTKSLQLYILMFSIPLLCFA
jgi:hypothetical protein